MAKRTLDFLNGLLSLFVAVIVLTFGAYSVYALWDNNRIYTAVDDVQSALLKLKPSADAEESGASFEELLAINKDVCGWVTLDNTAIDYPILQGENILTYINTDVYGKFALAGSIFLDTDNDRTFHDAYSLIYGHHMDQHKMFGDLDLYKEKKFFDENTTGMLILPDRSYELEIFACLLIESSEDAIFGVEQWLTDIEGLLEFSEKEALHQHQETVDLLRKDEKPQVLALSTCATEFTDARTIVLARMVPYKAESAGAADISEE
ncbi:MAG: class B sortase [Eubacteriales bacterium]|nr:class B sortase [Eubacteriales bacterium]